MRDNDDQGVLLYEYKLGFVLYRECERELTFTYKTTEYAPTEIKAIDNAKKKLKNIGWFKFYEYVIDHIIIE